MQRFIGGLTPPPRTHADLGQQVMADTDLLTRMGEVDEAAHRLLDARQRAWLARAAQDEAKAEQAMFEAHRILEGLPGKNEQERQAHLLGEVVACPDYRDWQQCRRDAAQAQHDAEAAQTRFDTAKALLRAATAAVGALGGQS